MVGHWRIVGGDGVEQRVLMERPPSHVAREDGGVVGGVDCGMPVVVEYIAYSGGLPCRELRRRSV